MQITTTSATRHQSNEPTMASEVEYTVHGCSVQMTALDAVHQIVTLHIQ